MANWPTGPAPPTATTAEAADRVAAVHRVVGDGGDLRYVASRPAGRVRLLTVIAMVAWLIIAHDRWEKPDRETPAELARRRQSGPRPVVTTRNPAAGTTRKIHPAAVASDPQH
ncbi:hypothetical protein AB0C12_31485 [Actinoplanes sp. NPDC048967]|uniref:hypothetical protein n=1 Tax=Actinoplanes sp. NPDC048967 TaxID=3155269 RepID=UPI0033FE3037